MSWALAENESMETLKQVRTSRPMPGRYYLEKWYRMEEKMNFLPPCETKLVTCEIVRFSTPFPAVLDDRAFVYVPALGLLRGVISRAMGPTSEIELALSPNDRCKLAGRILWADLQAGFRGTDPRRFPRYVPANPDSSLTLPDGTSFDCRVLNLSPSGAFIASTLRPPIDSAILLGRIQSAIRRHTEDGFAVEFDDVQDPATLEVLVAREQIEAAGDLLILRSEDAHA